MERRDKSLVMAILLAACAILAYYVDVIKGETVVYTHFFYIPVILAGLWYHKKAAVPLAFSLGLLHLLLTFFYTPPISIAEFSRVSALIIVAYVIGLISERRAKGEEALQTSKTSFHNIVERSADGIAIVDRKGIVRFANTTLKSMLGCKTEELVGESFGFPIMPSESKEIDIILKCGGAGEAGIGDMRVMETKWDGESAYLVSIRDITEQKLAEAKIREIKAYLDNIIKSSADAIIVVDMNEIVRHWNKSAESIMGYTADEVIGTSNKKFFADTEEADRIMECLKSEEKIRNYRTIVVRKDGKPIHISMSAALLRNKNGIPIGSVRVSRDITKEVELEEEIKREHDRLYSILETMVDGVCIVSKEYKLEFMNKALKDEFGEHVGDFCYEVFHGREEPCPLCKIPEVMMGKTVRRESHFRKRKKIYDLIETLLRYPDDTLSKLTIFRDITEWKKAEKELQESWEKYRSLVESTDDSIYVVDRDCRYLFINDKHLSRLGLPPEKIIGKTYGDCHAEEETKKFTEMVEKVFETGKPVQQEHRSQRDLKYFLRTFSPFKGADGRIIGVTVVSKDINRLKQIEKELEAKNTELERFAYTVSHDLKSPLITIQGFTKMLREDLERNEKEKVKGDLKFIEKGAAKMEHLLNDTLELSRIGRIANPPEDVPFGDIVKEALEQITGEIKSSGVEVSVAEDFPTVHVDKMRIVQVLVNLIANSINYRGDQPNPKIEIGYRIDGEETVFFVRDNGIGIDKSQQEKVFELFYKVDSRSGVTGTGAGLAIVKRIIEVHNGRIWIESEKGKGCTVCFTLPVVYMV